MPLTLVFEQDVDRWMITQQYGPITPQEVQLSPEPVLDSVAAYASQKGLRVERIYLPEGI